VDLKSFIIGLFAFLTASSPYSLVNPSIPENKAVFIPSFSLKEVFSADHSWVNNLPKEKTLTLITTGDVIPARSVNWKMTIDNDFTYPFKKTADFLKSADLTLINLESPLTNPCPITQEGMVFCGSQRFIEGLKFADIDVVNLANNHIFNWGEAGFKQTLNLLQKNGVLPSGSPLPLAIKNIKGFNFGFLGYNILNNPNETQILEQIRQAKSQVDFLVVSFHWGVEYQRYPARQTINLAHKSIDAGADLIDGNHPHWYQPIEIYKEKPIIYAQGNFIFDQEWSRETKIGFLAKHTIYKGKVVDLQIFPIFIHNYSQPIFPEENIKIEVLSDLKNISTSLNFK
jgi:poly-gamma-glutamate capsule biosynthesis protein CapA/YwtB (metallophosphatase superfamily)